MKNNIADYSFSPPKSPEGGLEKGRISIKSFLKHKDTPQYITALARQNRIRQTPQEEKLWSILSGKKIKGMKFRRRFPIGRYVADFYNHSNRLVIEVDGGIHAKRTKYDGHRDFYFKSCGYTVLRFTNCEIEQDIETVVLKVLDYL